MTEHRSQDTEKPASPGRLGDDRPQPDPAYLAACKAANAANRLGGGERDDVPSSGRRVYVSGDNSKPSDEIEGAIADEQPSKRPSLDQAKARVRSQVAAAAARTAPPLRGKAPVVATKAALRRALGRAVVAGSSEPPTPEKRSKTSEQVAQEFIARYGAKSPPSTESVSLTKAANTVQAIKLGLEEGAPGPPGPSELRAGKCFQLFARARRLSAVAARSNWHSMLSCNCRPRIELASCC